MSSETMLARGLIVAWKLRWHLNKAVEVISVIGGTDDQIRIIGRVLESKVRWQQNSWSQSIAAGGKSTLCIAVCVPLCEQRVSDLVALSHRSPMLPLIIVTDTAPESVRGLAQVRAPEAVLLERVDQDLWPACNRVLKYGIARQFAAALEISEAAAQDPELVSELVRALNSGGPVPRVKTLARQLDVRPAAVTRRFRRLFNATPRNVLPLLRLAIACDARNAGLTHMQSARSVSVHVRTLERFNARVGLNRGRSGDLTNLLERLLPPVQTAAESAGQG